LRQAVAWRNRKLLEQLRHPIRVRVNWEGIRPEDAQLYSIYIG